MYIDCKWTEHDSARYNALHTFFEPFCKKMGLTLSFLHRRKNQDKLLLNRLRVELDVDEFGDTFEMLADRYHKHRLQDESVKFNNRRRKYESLLNTNSKQLLREALATDGGLQKVVESFTPQEVQLLRKDLEIRGLEEAKPNVLHATAADEQKLDISTHPEKPQEKPQAKPKAEKVIW